jgi:HD-GYP domain-containing protein (c-di-GMP phosphodiesterase class II)
MFQTDLGRADAVLAALEKKRTDVAAHSRRVSAYSVRLAAQFGLADEVIETIRPDAARRWKMWRRRESWEARR